MTRGTLSLLQAGRRHLTSWRRRTCPRLIAASPKNRCIRASPRHIACSPSNPKPAIASRLVLRWDTLHVDRNGNGDLTEAGERTTPEATDSDPANFRPITILRPDGKTAEKFSFALFGWFGLPG